MLDRALVWLISVKINIPIKLLVCVIHVENLILINHSHL